MADYKVENAVAQKIFEDTVGYDKKNLIDIEKIKEFYEKCDKNFEEYKKTGGWIPYAVGQRRELPEKPMGNLEVNNGKTD